MMWAEVMFIYQNFPVKLTLSKDMDKELKELQKQFMQVSEDDETYHNPVDLLFEDLGKKKPKSFAVRQYKLYKLAAGKTAKSILISCGARLAPFDIQEVRDATMQTSSICS